jgi:hypothetical protein
MSVATPLADPRAEVERVLNAAETAGLMLRAVGGLAIYLLCPSARRPPLARSYKDIDFVTSADSAREVAEFLAGLGYRPDEEFNRLHGHQRLYFWDVANARQLDVFVERFLMCHELDLGSRLGLHGRTLSPADLLLTKLQVVQVNEKDLKDAAALLADLPIVKQGIDPARVTGVLTTDWGWWRTATETFDRVRDYASSVDGFPGATTIAERIDELCATISASPKSLKWKLRARVGERARWYEEPEEIEG